MNQSLAELILNHGKIQAFILTAVVMFVIAAGIFITLIIPFVLFGVLSTEQALYSAAGCGAGTALVNATFAAIIA